MATIVGFLTVGSTLTGTEDGDQIYGNARGPVNVATGSDRIFGRGGGDRIVGDTGLFENSNGDPVTGVIGPAGRGGDDVIQGGDGNDVIWGDTDGALLGIGGNDILYQNAGRGNLVGDGFMLSSTSRCGNDQLFGDGSLIGDGRIGSGALLGHDLLVATGSSGEGSTLWGDVDDTVDAATVGGRDTLKGGAFADALIGDVAGLSDASRGGNDKLWGNGGEDLLFGDASSLFETSRGGNDVLRGGSGDDLIYGEGERLTEFAHGGDDRLIGGAGDDELWGDGELIGPDASGGKDKFVFSGNFGDDQILDFRTGDGDQIVLQGLTQLDVQISIVTVTDPNDTTLITTLGGESITLVGFTGSLAVGTDIVFA